MPLPQPRPTPAAALSLALAGPGLVLAFALPFGPHSVAAASLSLAAYLVGTLLVLASRRHIPAPIPLATRLTLARGALAAWLLGLCLAPSSASAHATSVLAVALVELALDFADGKIARRRGESTAFGGLLDGEIDAVVVLALGLLVFSMHGAHTWPALGIAGFRYFLLAAAALFPRLRGQVPSSLRAKIICDWQIVTLLVCLLPLPFLAPFHLPLLALALALLAYSFAHDVHYLLGHNS